MRKKEEGTDVLNRFLRGKQAMPGDSAQPGPATREINVVQAVRTLAAGGVQLVDVRESNEWASGHIPGAVHIPLRDVGRRSAELDPGLPVITVCRSGRRSLIAVDELQTRGFANATSLAGGVIAWREAGQPIAR
jgi:rhodanese-related sulfurtransferase